MAIHDVTSSAFPAQGRPPLTITSEEISRYAEISALVSQLEAQQKALRAELLSLHASGAEQETDSPYLLAFVDQERRTPDWKSEAITLAAKVYGVEGVTAWKLQTEQAAPVQAITQVRVKPNPSFAAGLKKPVTPVMAPAPIVHREVVTRFTSRAKGGA